MKCDSQAAAVVTAPSRQVGPGAVGAGPIRCGLPHVVSVAMPWQLIGMKSRTSYVRSVAVKPGGVLWLWRGIRCEVGRMSLVNPLPAFIHPPGFRAT